MTHSRILDWIEKEQVIAVLRAPALSYQQLMEITDAIVSGGISVIELTLTTPNALEYIARLPTREDILLGVGTVLDLEDLRQSHEAGATFYASPVHDTGLISAARAFNMVAMPGASTPTEVYSAWKAGGDFIKLFPMPAQGLSYLRSMQGPFPTIKFTPSGGITDTTAAEYIRAGAAAINVGSWLTHSDRGHIDTPEAIANRARSLIEAIKSQ